MPAAMKEANGVYDPSSLWWTAERLNMLVSVDENRFAPEVQTILNDFHNDSLQMVHDCEEQALSLIEKGQMVRAMQLLSALTQHETDRLMRVMRSLADRISSEIEAIGGLYGPRKEFLEAYAARVHMPL